MAASSTPTVVRWTPELAASWELLSPRIERLARRFNSSARRGGHCKDDLTQIAAVAFPRWVSRFDPSRGISLRSFVSVCCARLFIQVGRTAYPETRDLHELADRADGDAFAVDLADELEGIVGDDPRRAQKIRGFLDLYLGKWTLAEIAAREGVSVTTVHAWSAQIAEGYLLKRQAADRSRQPTDRPPAG